MGNSSPWDAKKGDWLSSLIKRIQWLSGGYLGYVMGKTRRANLIWKDGFCWLKVRDICVSASK